MAGSRDQSEPWKLIGVRHPSLSAGRGGDGYPPYDIERIVSDGRTLLRITIAVAGFDASELDIQVVGDELTVRGRQTDKGDAQYFFRGIAARPFQRVFRLPQGADVSSARLGKGLLIIELLQPEQVETVRKINISRSK